MMARTVTRLGTGKCGENRLPYDIYTLRHLKIRPKIFLNLKLTNLEWDIYNMKKNIILDSGCKKKGNK
jgi:hypothetical protein